MTLKVLDLFSGIGGFSLGLERAGMTTIAFCEIESFCRSVLQKHWPTVPIFNDIRTLTADDLQEQPDLICGGYPCQPFSVAGKQKGKADDRHLWPQMFRIIKECRPAWVLAENVAGHIRMGLDDVLFDLEGEGYTTSTFVIPACAVNAPHRRDRVWIVGYSEHYGLPASEVGRVNHKATDARSKEQNSPQQFTGASEPRVHGSVGQELPSDKERALANTYGLRMERQRSEQQAAGVSRESEIVADTQSQRVQRHRTSGQQKSSTHDEEKLSVRQSERPVTAFWEAESGICTVADGIPNRVDRIKALGNSVVPQIPEIIGRAILSSLPCP